MLLSVSTAMTALRWRRGALAVGVAAAAWAVVLLSPGCSRSGSADVWPALSAERSTTYELSIQTQINHAVMITGEKSAIDTLGLRFRVETVDEPVDGGPNVAMIVERFAYINAGESRSRVRFDSDLSDDQNESENMTPLFRAVSGLEIGLRVAPDGSVTYVDGLEPIEALIRDREDREQLGTVFQAVWWEDLGRSVFRLGCDQRRVRVGDAWTDDAAFVGQGFLSVSGLLERRVVSITADRIEIEETGGFSVDFSKDAFASQEEAAVDEQDMTGRVIWDRRHGRLQEEQRDLVLQLSQTWQGIVLAKRHAVSRTLRRVSGKP